jgi:hypothetical protein
MTENPPPGAERVEAPAMDDGLLGCDQPGHPNNYAHRCAEWDERLRRPEGFTPAELCRRAPDDGAPDLTIVESFDVD